MTEVRGQRAECGVACNSWRVSLKMGSIMAVATRGTAFAVYKLTFGLQQRAFEISKLSPVEEKNS